MNFITSPPRVRFAPSPTGDLHVGGVRTALFNYLYSRHYGGEFLLRIEDTDRERSTPEAIQVILDGLKWIGIEPDEPVVYQSQRIDRHREAAYQILESELGYRCFCNPDELAARREAARASGMQFKYDRACLRLTPAEVEARLAQGLPYAIRVRVPDEDLTFEDGVHGAVRILGSELEDFVLLRGDGTPTYMLAVVVDDADMGITQIIRGDEHLLNTPKQILLYRALGRPVPAFAHVPLILGTDKKKLSKRHGATSITWYRDQGFLPEAMINFLGLLGWSPGDDRNVIGLDELISLFDIAGIIPHGAVFDEAKLTWLNSQYLSRKMWSEVEPVVLALADSALAEGRIGHIPDEAYLANVWELLKSRIYRLGDLFGSALYMFRDPDSYDGKGVNKHFSGPDTAGQLRVLAGDFGGIEVFDASSIEEVVRRRAEEWGVSAGALIHPLRLAVSGTTVGPGLFEMLEVLGRAAVFARLERAAEWVERMPSGK
ncbi:MAG: glutamate--tRNA ligase [Calditrichaeota bacterium]|nr:glutamate--tRNA ligase [Calditrichota bacterium]